MTEISEDRVKLEADGIVSLFEIIIPGSGSVFLKANDAATWQGDDYEAIAIQIDGESKTADEEMSRPKLSVANPDGIFTQYVLANNLESAVVKRYRVLRAHLDADLNIFTQDTWRISRVVLMNKVIVQFELRKPYDGPVFAVPARMYTAPDFPSVSLQ